MALARVHSLCKKIGGAVHVNQGGLLLVAGGVPGARRECVVLARTRR